jgi:hypothetical protein
VQPSDNNDFNSLEEAIKALVVSATDGDADKDAEQFITLLGAL